MKILVFKCRNTKNTSAVTLYHLFKVEKGVPILIKPKILNTSKSGSYWEQHYCVDENEKLLIICKDISNAGNHHCRLTTINVDLSHIHLTQDVLNVMCNCLLQKLGIC